jgi:hypothetical protein
MVVDELHHVPPFEPARSISATTKFDVRYEGLDPGAMVLHPRNAHRYGDPIAERKA